MPAWEKGEGRRGGQGAGGKEHSSVSKSWSPPPGCPCSPDVQTAERGKENPRGEGQGDSQEHCQELVNHVFADFEEGMAADPHLVKGVRGLGLRDHILEVHLRRRGRVPSCLQTRPGSQALSGRGEQKGRARQGCPPSLRDKVGTQNCG